MRRRQILRDIDWITIALYFVLMIIGWLNIYAADFKEEFPNIFDLSQNYGKQVLWMGTALIIGATILIIEVKFYSGFSYPIYALVLLSLVAVLFFGTEIAGSRSWFEIGSVKIQPTEFAKFATNLAVARYLTTINVNLKDLKTKLIAISMFMIPAILVVFQGDTGSAIVYIGFFLVLYRAGLPANMLVVGVVITLVSVLALVINKFVMVGVLLALGILAFINFRKNRSALVVIAGSFIFLSICILSVDYVFNEVLKPHQQNRINVLLGKDVDLKGAAYNVNQSKIAIGSGGLMGKGFLNGTQTKFDFVPEQSTDFIFTTIGEEHGFMGSLVVLSLFLTLLLRIVFLAERQRSDFARLYGYGVASILFVHLAINIGMTIGLAPVIGIPLPFISYGGSSLWAFTILLFILIRLDGDRMVGLR